MKSLLVAALLTVVGCDRLRESDDVEASEPIDIRHLTDDDYDGFIATPGKLAVVMFHAGWCAPCKKQGPIIEEIVEDYGGRAILGMMDVDDYGEFAKGLGVNGIPDVRLYRKGVMVDAMKGAVPEEQVRSHFAIQIEQLGASDDAVSESTKAEPPIRPMSKDWRPPGVERR